MLKREDTGSEARLVAYIVSAGERQPEPDDLRGFLRTNAAILYDSGELFLPGSKCR